MSHVEAGKAFFIKHGGKSVFLGRFVGPLRQIIPFVAGVVRMEQRRFVFLNVLGGVLWAYVYIIIGYYFGANWKLVDEVISRIGIILSAIIVFSIMIAFNRRRNRKLDALKEVDSTSLDILK